MLHTEQEITTTFSFRRSSHLLLHVKEGTHHDEIQETHSREEQEASRLLDPKQKIALPWSEDQPRLNPPPLQEVGHEKVRKTKEHQDPEGRGVLDSESEVVGLAVGAGNLPLRLNSTTKGD